MDYRLYVKRYAGQIHWDRVVGGTFSNKKTAKGYGERSKKAGTIARYKVVPVRRKRRKRKRR